MISEQPLAVLKDNRKHLAIKGLSHLGFCLVYGLGMVFRLDWSRKLTTRYKEFCEEDCICITTIQEEADFLPKTINEQEDVPA